MRQAIRTLTLLLGLVCMATAGYLFVDHWQEEQVAQTASDDVVYAFSEQIQLAQLTKPEVISLSTMPDNTEDLNELEELEEETQDDMPTVIIDGEQYVALLSIPWLGLELPIAQNCNDANLEKTPCVFSGSLANHNLVIAGHNYKAHFGGLHRLVLGSSATLMDATGQVHHYTLAELEQVDGDDAVSIVSGDWDMTIFTCVYGDNTQRDVLRFQLVEQK